jgi:hypothetical protein
MPTGGPRLKYAESVGQTVEACLRAGVNVVQIAKDVHISHQWVSSLRQNLDTFDTVSPTSFGVGPALEDHTTRQKREGQCPVDVIQVLPPHSPSLFVDSLDSELWYRSGCRAAALASAAFHHAERAPGVTSSLTAEPSTIRSLKTSFVPIQGFSLPVSCAQGRLVNVGVGQIGRLLTLSSNFGSCALLGQHYS